MAPEMVLAPALVDLLSSTSAAMAMAAALVDALSSTSAGGGPADQMATAVANSVAATDTLLRGRKGAIREAKNDADIATCVRLA